MTRPAVVVHHEHLSPRAERQETGHREARVREYQIQSRGRGDSELVTVHHASRCGRADEQLGGLGKTRSADLKETGPQ